MPKKFCRYLGIGTLNSPLPACCDSFQRRNARFESAMAHALRETVSNLKVLLYSSQPGYSVTTLENPNTNAEIVGTKSHTLNR
jgi:hypothetical protein